MTSYKLEIIASEKLQLFKMESAKKREAQSARKMKEMVKPLVLRLSEALIFLGTGLQNLYQPPIQQTIMEYKSHK